MACLPQGGNDFTLSGQLAAQFLGAHDGSPSGANGQLYAHCNDRNVRIEAAAREKGLREEQFARAHADATLSILLVVFVSLDPS